MPLGFAHLQVTSFMVEIWILDYLWGKKSPQNHIFKHDSLDSDAIN